MNKNEIEMMQTEMQQEMELLVRHSKLSQEGAKASLKEAVQRKIVELQEFLADLEVSQMTLTLPDLRNAEQALAFYNCQAMQTYSFEIAAKHVVATCREAK